MAPTQDKDREPPLFGEHIDQSTFDQILEMDEPNDNEFSTSIVFGFFAQAKETFQKMDTALTVHESRDDKDLKELSELGHFLKGSSATLGLIKVRDGCERIQRYGKNENLDGSAEPDSNVCLSRIAEAIEDVKRDYDIVEKRLSAFYGREPDSDV
ncbi:Phosphorelay intermediate protein [Conoideocrella luteorostrata]|uniref:Phosphorelay intermediate protein n=1 Tax=Conoideocrella luteorostrata TaxID=1105319 RepID=A0AAJ0FRJ1_9HYPO|nr:Phosphorelay intermediate protein [Conoideocrella luteorostrata]